jgi:hypothetical protein
MPRAILKNTEGLLCLSLNLIYDLKEYSQQIFRENVLLKNNDIVWFWELYICIATEELLSKNKSRSNHNRQLKYLNIHFVTVQF